MPARYDTYGFATLDLNEAASLVERALGVRLRQRDSSYWGLYYCAGRGPERDYMLYRNADPAYQRRYEGYRVILNVNAPGDMAAIRRALTEGRSEPVLLRSVVLPDEPPDAPATG